MNSKQKDEKVITPKKFYLQQEVYEQIINGFQSAKEREMVDQKKMGVVLRVQQIYRLKISSPFIFGGFFGAEWFKSIFYDQYKKQKIKKMNDIRKSFFYSWYDLDWWFKKLKSDEQQFDAEKDKDNWFSKFYKAYKRISMISRWYKAIKTFIQSCRDSQAVNALFSQKYNLTNQSDYRKFENRLNWVVQSAEELFKPSILVLTKPIMMELSALYVIKLQQLYDRFCWWVVKTILVGTTWWQVAISVIGYAASIVTLGASGSALIASRVAAMIARLSSIFGKFATIGGRLVRSSNALIRGFGKLSNLAGRGFRGLSGALTRASQGMRGWGATVGRNALSGNYRRATQAFMRRHPRLIKYSKSAIQGAVPIVLFYLDDEIHLRVKRYIRHRTGLMYLRVLPHLQNLKNTGQMADDIVSFVGKAGRVTMRQFEDTEQRRLEQQQFRTNARYNKNLKIKRSQYKNNKFFVALDLFTRRLNFFANILASGIGKVTGQIKGMYANFTRTSTENQRYIASLGSGIFGVALYKNRKRLVFENVYFSPEDEFQVQGQLESDYYSSIAFQLSNLQDSFLQRLTIFVNGNSTPLHQINFGGQYSTNQGKTRAENKIAVEEFDWLWQDGWGSQYGSKKGARIKFRNISLPNETHAFYKVENNQLLFNHNNYFGKGNQKGLYPSNDGSQTNDFYYIKNIYQKKEMQRDKQKQFTQQCKIALDWLMESISQTNEYNQRLRQQIQNELRLLSQATYYTGKEHVQFEDYYQTADSIDGAIAAGKDTIMNVARTTPVGMAMTAMSGNSVLPNMNNTVAHANLVERQLAQRTISLVQSGRGGMDIISDANGGVLGQHVRDHSDNYGCDKSWRKVTGYRLTGRHAVNALTTEQKRAIQEANREELQAMLSGLRNISANRSHVSAHGTVVSQQHGNSYVGMDINAEIGRVIPSRK